MLHFHAFFGLLLEDKVLDAKTVWLLCAKIKGLNLIDNLFTGFHQQLPTRGYVARAGQIIDAIFVEVPQYRNRREEYAQIKEGKTPDASDEPEAKAKRC